MQLSEALRWTVYYRGIALVSFLVGAALAAAGIWIGFVDLILNEVPGASAGGPPEPTTVLGGGLLILFGFVVWQIGKTAAFYKTVTEATESQMADRFDTQTVKSEILSVLDDRLSDMQAEVEMTRQHVDRLGVDEHADDLIVDEELTARDETTTEDTAGSVSDADATMPGTTSDLPATEEGNDGDRSQDVPEP